VTGRPEGETGRPACCREIHKKGGHRSFSGETERNIRSIEIRMEKEETACTGWKNIEEKPLPRGFSS